MIRIRKNIIIIFLLTFVTLFFIGCDIFIPVEDDPQDKEVKVSGIVEDNVYKNEYFDLSLTIPAHWYFVKEGNEPLTFFSDRTDEDKKVSELNIECLALNDVTGDAIEITVEKIPNLWSYDMWKSRNEYFNNIPNAFGSTGGQLVEISNKEFDGRGYVIYNQESQICGRAAFYYTAVENYIICVTLIADNFFIETGLSKSIGRMIDWFGTFTSPSTKPNAENGGYYLNDIISPSYTSTFFYSGYRRDQPFEIAGKTYYDCIPLDNGQSFGPGKTKDAIFYLDGKTYKELTFTVGVMDEKITTRTKSYAAFEILFDDKQVWEERFYAFTKPETFTIDITGVKKLTFRIRDNWTLTELCIADPIISEEKRIVDNTIQVVDETVDFLDNAIQYYKDTSTSIYYGNEGKTFTVSGKQYNKGLILHDTRAFNGNIYFNLEGKYTQFNFSVGVIAETMYPNNGWLNIYLDGKKILDVSLDYDVPKKSYSLDVSGGHILCIESSSGDDYGIHQADYALYNMTLGKEIKEDVDKINPGSYKLISEIGEPFSTRGVNVYDGSTKFRGYYVGDIFYNEGISMMSIYSILSSSVTEADPAKASFDLGGNFKYLTFTVGRVDKSHVENDVLVVYGDGKELAHYELVATDFSQQYELNVEGVEVLQFQLLGFAKLLRGTYMVADIAVHTDEINYVDFPKPEQAEFPEEVDLMERFKPYEYMSSEGNGHDAVRYFNGIFDGSDNKKYFTIDGINHNRGFVLSTSVYLSLDGVSGIVGASLATLTIFAIVASSEVSQASFACFNLHEQYKTLTFNIGVIDGQNENDNRSQPYDKLYVIADEKIVGEYILTGDMATKEITVDIENCGRLAFWLDHNKNSYSYGIFDANIKK